MGARAVTVRAFPREGYDRFFRGGYAWPVEGRTVFVTEDLLNVLRKEKNLNVDLEPEGMPENGTPLDLKDNRAFYDHAWNASRATRLALAEEERQLMVMEAELKLEEIRKKKAEVAAKLAASKKSK